MATPQPSGSMASVSRRFISLKSLSILFFHCFLGRPLIFTPGTSSSITYPNILSPLSRFTWPNHFNRSSLTTVNSGFTPHLLATSSPAFGQQRRLRPCTTASYGQMLRSGRLYCFSCPSSVTHI